MLEPTKPFASISKSDLVRSMAEMLAGMQQSKGINSGKGGGSVVEEGGPGEASQGSPCCRKCVLDAHTTVP